MNSPKAYRQPVLVEFNNSCPYVEVFTSDKPITIARVANHYIATEDFNEERDSLTFLDALTDTLDLDHAEAQREEA